jgi:hypothetical protein
VQPLQQLARRREFVHESEAWEVEIVVLRCVLLGIGHIQIPIDLLDVEWRKTLRDFFVLERSVIILTLTAKTDGLEGGVVNLDTPGTDIRDVKVKRSASVPVPSIRQERWFRLIHCGPNRLAMALRRVSIGQA